MAEPPIVVLGLTDKLAPRMFRPEDLAKLTAVARVLGPIPGEKVDPAVLKSMLPGATVLISGWGTPSIDASILAAGDSLELIAHSAGSVKHLVNDAVYDRGIRVTTSAGVNAVPVAQLTIGLMITMLKQIPWIADAYRAGRSDEVKARHAVCRELQDLSVGLISASRVGREVLKLLAPYPRLTIKLYDPFVTPEQARQMGVQLVSLEEACRCTIVSIHAPNIPETKHLFNAERLKLIPDHGILINTARGAIVDEAALVAEVKRRPLYVALDVTDPEPPKPDSPLRTAPNVLLTPHIAGAITQARLDMGALAIEETLRYLQTGNVTNEVTRAMLPTQA
jgi:phosphoglycerate dehydrogenase-like enzyme